MLIGDIKHFIITQSDSRVLASQNVILPDLVNGDDFHTIANLKCNIIA